MMTIKSNLFAIVLISVAINLNVGIYKLYGRKPSQTDAAPVAPPAIPATPVEPKFNSPIKPIPPVEKEPPLPVAPTIPEPDFVEVKKVTDSYREDSVYADIMNRARRPFTREDRDTNAHESTHGINADIRNTHPDSTKVNGFYVLNGKGVVIYEPHMRKSAMIPYVPQSLRGFRYNTYVAGQQAWDERPLYIFDEWVAYVNGATVSVEDVRKGRHNGKWSDNMSGSLEFSVYSVAVAMAVEKNDPEYWKTNKQFKNFVYWHLKRSYDVYMSGKDMKEFKYDKQDKFLESLRTSPDAQQMRDFIEKHFGGIWLK